MSSFKEYDRYDGLGLAKLVREKEVSPSELCEEAIRRIEQVNPKVNAVITRMYDIGRKRAQSELLEGPFAGVPFLLKDIIDEYAGVPLTMGSRAFRNYVPAQDSEMVVRYKKGGVVILGKTNVMRGARCPQALRFRRTAARLRGLTAAHPRTLCLYAENDSV